MNNKLILFSFKNNEIRTILQDGNPWFIAKDVATALEYVWNGTECIKHIPEEWRGISSVLTPFGNQKMAILSEQGLYFFLGRSDKPAALPFQKWIAGEVIPSIRKTGNYTLPNKTPAETYPYLFLLQDNAAELMDVLLDYHKQEIINTQELRSIILWTKQDNTTEKQKRESKTLLAEALEYVKQRAETNDPIVSGFIDEHVHITMNTKDYIPVHDVYELFLEKTSLSISQNIFTRTMKRLYPVLDHKQKKINAYPVLVFSGCTWRKNP